ncbi:MAG: hypothetical protein WBF43_12895 [Methylocella sp.]
MTTIVLETRLLFGPDPDGGAATRMSFAALETPEESLEDAGGMYGARGYPRRDFDDDRFARPRPGIDHHRRPFDRTALSHHHRPFDKAAEAIAPASGRHGTHSYRNNNPGNVKYGALAKRFGAIGRDASGFAVFPDAATGERAQRGLWESGGYSHATIGEALHRWSGGGYRALPGVDSGKRWADLSPGEQDTLLQAQKRREGWAGSGGGGGLTPEHHGRYRGELDIGGDKFQFVSGGRGAGSSPPGDRTITGYLPGHLGGGEGRFATSDVYDPQAGRTRSLVRIHATSSSDIDKAVSSGCFGVDKAQWPRLKRELNSELAAHGGKMTLHVDENGNAQIFPVGGSSRGKFFSPHKNLADVAETMSGLRDRDPEGHGKIEEYLKTGGAGMDPATRNWCAAFVAATARHAGLGTPRDANVATAWETYGTPVRPQDVRRGDIMIGGTTGRKVGSLGGHVAIVAGPLKGTKIPIVEGDQRTDVGSYKTSPGSMHSTVATGPAYTGGHRVGANEVDIVADEGLKFRRPPDADESK